MDGHQLQAIKDEYNRGATTVNVDSFATPMTKGNPNYKMDAPLVFGGPKKKKRFYAPVLIQLSSGQQNMQKLINRLLRGGSIRSRKRLPLSITKFGYMA